MLRRRRRDADPAKKKKASLITNNWAHHIQIPFDPDAITEEIDGIDLKAVDRTLSQMVKVFLASGGTLEPDPSGVRWKAHRNLIRVLDRVPQAAKQHFYSLNEISTLVISMAWSDVVEVDVILDVVRSSFPKSLAGNANTVGLLVPISTIAPQPGEQVAVSGETLEIPGRVFWPEPNPDRASSLTEIEQIMLSCLYSRHTSGYVRERHLMRILNCDEPWVPPYVLNSLGDYVIEVSEVVARSASSLPKEAYMRFATENRQYLATLRRRSVNFWAMYYRSIPFEEYPAYRTLSNLGLWSGRTPRRWPRHTQPLDQFREIVRNANPSSARKPE